MKLPHKFDKYSHNSQMDKLNSLVTNLTWDCGSKECNIKQICTDNLERLKKISAIITHLELVIDEVLKVPGVSDE